MTREKPMHRQIAEQLRKRIASGYYPTLELPPELTLMDEFDVSRHTVRAALQWLVNDGLIERRAGSGTRITNRGKGGTWVIGALNELIGEFTPDQYLTLSAGIVPAKRFPSAAAMFGVPKQGSLFHIKRILTIRDTPYALAEVFTSSAYGLAVPPAELGVKPLIHLVEAHARVRATRARQLATATAADEQTARQIGIPVGTPVLVLHRSYFDADDQPIVHTELFCRPDRYQQVIDFVHEATGAADDTPKALENIQ